MKSATLRRHTTRNNAHFSAHQPPYWRVLVIVLWPLSCFASTRRPLCCARGRILINPPHHFCCLAAFWQGILFDALDDVFWGD
jgi:hypothetical protein